MTVIGRCFHQYAISRHQLLFPDNEYLSLLQTEAMPISTANYILYSYLCLIAFTFHLSYLIVSKHFHTVAVVSP